MDIKIVKEKNDSSNYFENYANETLGKLFDNFPFIQSIKVFFRAKKHTTKKIKLQARVKGKDVFVEASGTRYNNAIDNATAKLKTQLEKHKTKLYKKAS